MDPKKREALEKAGWTVGDTQELLGLSDEDMVVIRIRASLAQQVRARREERQLTQAQAAKAIGTSQPRVACAEKGDASIETLVKALAALGSTREEIAEAVAG